VWHIIAFINFFLFDLIHYSISILREKERERAPREKDRETGLWFQGQPGSNKNRRVHPGTGGDRDCQEGYPLKTEGRRVWGDRRQGRVKNLYCQNDIKT
jgi:hypothetical protein